MGLGQKRTSLLVQAHNRNIYCGREPQQILIVTQVTAVFGQNQQLSIQPYIAFPFFPCHALPTLYLEPALAQAWSRVHQFHLLNQQKITLAKIATFSWVSEANWLSVQTGKCQSRGGGGRGISVFSVSKLWPARLGSPSQASLQALWEQIAHLASEDISADKEDVGGIKKNSIYRKVVCLVSHNHSITELSTENPHTTASEQSYYPFPQIYFNFFFENIIFCCPQPPVLFKIASSWSAGVGSKYVSYIINHTSQPAKG